MISKENEMFHYRIHDNFIVIESVKEDFPVVEFPEMIEGIPVKELEAYVLSGKNCEEVYIPEGVCKIGRYGFYNCKKLRKLAFSSDFMDIGSGAFTGCHQIREIEVLMKKEQTCLREVLVEVPEEVCVKLLWEKKAENPMDALEVSGQQNHERVKNKEYIEGIFWFPEYFEENVENTPARILSVRTHGSGMFYRHCFSGKVFQFREYDKCFEKACVFDKDRFLTELVYGRLSRPVELSDKSKAEYEIFVHEKKQIMAKNWIMDQKEEALEWLLSNYPHKKDEQEEYQELLECASKYGTTSMVSSLVNYGRKLFPPKRKTFDL